MVLQAHGAREILRVRLGGGAKCFLCLRIAVTHLTLCPTQDGRQVISDKKGCLDFNLIWLIGVAIVTVIHFSFSRRFKCFLVYSTLLPSSSCLRDDALKPLDTLYIILRG